MLDGVQIAMGRGNFQEWAMHYKVQGVPSMCGGDAGFCQIILTTCYYYYLRHFVAGVLF